MVIMNKLLRISTLVVLLTGENYSQMASRIVHTLLLTALVKQICGSKPFIIRPPSTHSHDEEIPGIRDLTIDQLIQRVMAQHQNQPSSDMPDNMAMLMSGDSDTELVEMDMVLTSAQRRNLYGSPSSRRSKRKAFKASKPWTNGVVPYLINPWDFSGNERAVIHVSMQEWEQHTCVKFRPSTTSDANKLVFQNGIGCNSQLGEVGGAQPVNLEAPGCRFKGLYLHEIGHALGLVHEHQLPNRDSYIDIIWENVKPEWREWFDKYKSSEFTSAYIPYDLESVMHYGITAFSYDEKSQTIRAKDNSRTYLIGRVFKKELSFNDIKLINVMYQCNKNCDSNIRCANGGFVDKNCKCYCPDGTNSCQTSPRTTTIPKVTCHNKHPSDAECNKWADEDQCSLNPLWMIENCRSSCDKCDRIAEPTVPPKECRNRESDDECDSFAKAGECSSSPSWMMYNCKASCGWCNQPSECHDLYPDSNQCRVWKNEGQCDRNPPWMWANCRQTCGVCGSEPAGCTNKAGDDKCYADSAVGECAENADYMLENCAKACGKCGTCYNEFPDDSACVDLEKAGECTLSPEWMGRYCKKACDACDGGLTIGVARPCADKDSRCERWASEGECESNPSWMIPNCQKSCRKCSCVNTGGDRDCETWATRGECDSNAPWMAMNCQKACRHCTNLPPPPDRCSNTYEDESKCVEWAAKGECFTNPLFMIPQCRKACTKCDIVSGCDNWGVWSSWTGCSRTCGSGMRSRSRRCRSGMGTQDEMKGCMTNVECPTVPPTTIGPVRPPIPTTRLPGRVTTTATPTIVTTTPSECENTHSRHSECEAWARGGHCDSNPSWMHSNCALSCGICTSNICENTYDDERCNAWADDDQCNQNPGFMLVNCARACDQCETVVPEVTTTPTPIDCVNNHRDCDIWARAGHCNINPGYMHKNCARACNLCSRGTSPTATTTTVAPPPDCEDRHRSCEVWARGERDYCTTSTYVKKNCKLSCNACSRRDSPQDYMEVGQCRDRSKKCTRWTLEGRCETAMRHMERTCPLSCELCSPELEPCVNTDSHCNTWTKHQACFIFPKLMAQKCRLACGYCRP